MVNEEDKTVTVSSKIYFYGTEATPERSKRYATAIASQWNDANGAVEHNGEEYDVKFDISYETVSEEEALEISAENGKNPYVNFMRVEDGGTKSNFALPFVPKPKILK